MQWVLIIKKIQQAGKSVVVDAQIVEIEDFIGAMDPKELMLCIPAEPEIRKDIFKQVKKW
jgi:hypothetical protein